MSPQVGPYEVLRLLQSGGQGEVYLGYDRRLSRQVAIKIYSLPKERGVRRALMERARLVASIQSPRVVQVHDVIASTEHLALVMEYVPGCDLEQALAARQPSVAAILSIATQVAAAIAAARQRRVVHGDIKPANLLLGTAGQVKLTDFGIARPSGESAAGEGSLVCLAPEQLRGEAVDSRTDLFALGCLLYRMLTGEHPFWSDEGLDVEALLHREPAPVISLWRGEETLPQGLGELVHSLLQKSPEDRPLNTHQVRQALRDMAGEFPLRAQDPVRSFASELLDRIETHEPPPEVPLGLRMRRSLLDTGRLSNLLRGQWLLASPLRRFTLVGLAAAAMLGLMLLAYRGWLAPERVLLNAPLVSAQSPGQLPISPAWLSRQLEEALVSRLGQRGVRVSGAIRPDPVLYREGRSPRGGAPRDRIRIALDCRAVACLLELQLERAGEMQRAQALVLSGESRAVWRLEMLGLLDELLEAEPGAARLVSWSAAGAAEGRYGGSQQEL